MLCDKCGKGIREICTAINTRHNNYIKKNKLFAISRFSFTREVSLVRFGSLPLAMQPQHQPAGGGPQQFPPTTASRFFITCGNK